MKKNILVTGGLGFIGSNFIKYIFKNSPEYQIINLDKVTYAANISNLIDLPNSFYRHIKGDICDKAILDNVFKEFNFDYVVNFAAETHVDRSIMGGAEFVQTNTNGTYTLLDCAREYGVERFLQVSTDEVYGELSWEHDRRVNEEDSMRPTNPYSASKAAAEESQAGRAASLAAASTRRPRALHRARRRQAP